MKCRDLAAVLLLTPDAEVVIYDKDLDFVSPVVGVIYEPAPAGYEDIMVNQVTLSSKDDNLDDNLG